MRAIRHALSPTSFGRLHLRLCSAGFRRSAERVSWNSVRYSWSFIAAGGGPESLFPLTPEYIAAGDVWITTGTDGQIAGFVGAGTPRCAGHTGLEQACSSIRRRHRPCAAPRSDEARQRGAERLTILADPNATRFYERNDGVRIGGSALGRRCPAALLLRGWIPDLGRYRVRRSKHQQAFGRVGELADPRDHRAPSVRTLALRRS